MHTYGRVRAHVVGEPARPALGTLAWRAEVCMHTAHVGGPVAQSHDVQHYVVGGARYVCVVVYMHGSYDHRPQYFT